MRSFDYIESDKTLLTPHITSLLAAIREAKGRQSIQTMIRPDILGALVTVARIQSTDASNRIEDISTSGSRLNDLTLEKVIPRDRNEEKITGYRDMLSVVHENHGYIPIIPNVIFQLHRDLFRRTPLTFAGRPRDSNNTIVERDVHGASTVRFTPSSVLVTPELIERACFAYAQTTRDEHTDPLLTIAMFIFDSAYTRSFSDGNGRMSRLLTPLILYRSGYMVGKYINIRHLIEQDESTHYEALAASTQGWDDNANDYAPFASYLLGIILPVCKESDERVNLTADGRTQRAPRAATKGARIEALLDQSLILLSRVDVPACTPDTSTTAIERTLKSLLDLGTIIRIGTGRSTRYAKCR